MIRGRTIRSSDIETRVVRLEGAVDQIGTEVAEVRSMVGGIGTKIDSLFGQMQTGDQRTAERAQAVKVEIRDEADRKSRERNELFKGALAAIGGIAIVVAAVAGPYASKINSTTDAREQDGKDIGDVRQILAQQGADITRNRDSQDIGREARRRDEDQLVDVQTRLAHLEGRFAR
jgi:hypothetical protein